MPSTSGGLQGQPAIELWLSAHRGPQGPSWGDCCALFWRPQKPTICLLSLKIPFVVQRYSRAMRPVSGEFALTRCRDRHWFFPKGFPVGSLGRVTLPLRSTRRSPTNTRQQSCSTFLSWSQLCHCDDQGNSPLPSFRKELAVTLDLRLPFAFPVQIGDSPHAFFLINFSCLFFCLPNSSPWLVSYKALDQLAHPRSLNALLASASFIF